MLIKQRVGVQVALAWVGIINFMSFSCLILCESRKLRVSKKYVAVGFDLLGFSPQTTCANKPIYRNDAQHVGNHLKPHKNLSVFPFHGVDRAKEQNGELSVWDWSLYIYKYCPNYLTELITLPEQLAWGWKKILRPSRSLQLPGRRLERWGFGLFVLLTLPSKFSFPL